MNVPRPSERERTRVERWLTKTHPHGPLAILVGSGSVNDLSFARSLGRRGVPTLMLAGKRLLGSYTRHGLVVRMAELDESPTEWMELLDLVASRLAVPAVLFATSDEHCLGTVWLRPWNGALRDPGIFGLTTSLTDPNTRR